MTHDLVDLLRAFTLYPVYLASELAEFFNTCKRYYRNAAFRRAELRYLLAYAFRSPDAMCQRYLKSHADSDVQKVYGETFFSTLHSIAKAVELSADDVVYDLGCGRGRGVFWFNAMLGCRAVGVEINPAFVQKAMKIKQKLGVEGVDFIHGNLMDIDYRDATVVYFYGTAFSDEAVEKIAGRLRSLRRGTRVVSVSFPLTHYIDASVFAVEKIIKGKFVWGSTDIYIQRKL